MRGRQRGQVVMMFAVMVPIFVIFLAFIIDIGQLYYEKSNVQRAADSVIRTVEKILGAGSTGERIDASAVPSTVEIYSTYAALKNDYPDAATALEQLESDINVLTATLNGMTIEQKFMVDGYRNLYYRVDASKTYNAVMKIASADDGSSSTDAATVAATMLIKFASDKNVVTGGGQSSSNDPESLTNQLLAADAVTRNEMLQSLVNPQTPTEIESNFGTLKNFFANKIAKTETAKAKLKSNVIQRMLKATAFSDQQKGEMCDAYLSSLVAEEPASTDLKIASLAEVRSYYAEVKSLNDILVAALSTIDTISAVESTLQNKIYTITYEDLSNGGLHHVITINSVGAINHTFY